MKIKPIIADPLRLYELGVRNLLDMATLIHIGRCGLVGVQRTAISQHMRVCYETARASVDRLCEMKLVTSASKGTSTGCPLNFVCTKAGWSVLTEPSDFTLFPWAQKPLALK